MKAYPILVLTLTLLGIPASADPPSAAPPQAPSAAGSGKTTVEGVTVMGRLPSGKRCRETDKDCLLVVAKEIWAKYPHDIALYCEKERMRRFSDRVNKEAMFGDTPGADSIIDSHLPPALEVVCGYKPATPPAAKPAN